MKQAVERYEEVDVCTYRRLKFHLHSSDRTKLAVLITSSAREEDEVPS